MSNEFESKPALTRSRFPTTANSTPTTDRITSIHIETSQTCLTDPLTSNHGYHSEDQVSIPRSPLRQAACRRPTPQYKAYGIKHSPNQHVLLEKGHAKEPGRKKLPIDCIAHRDTPIPMRDGLHVYADIYRPASSSEYHPEVKVPAAICWSPYGKSSMSIDALFYRSGVPREWTSGYETFEGLDPAEWCRRGYAVVNVDARGSQFSQSSFFFWGDQEAEDIYDEIDFLARQPWCTGSVCMDGCSYLAKAQLSFAAKLAHPGLKALAPWEGFTDIYRQLLRRGGFAVNSAFMKKYQWGIAGTNEVEDMASMVTFRPLFDDYWTGKYDEVARIVDLPMYLLASFSNPFHVYGSFDTFP